MTVVERLELDPERLWGLTAVTLVVAVVVGSLAFPRTVYDRFIWHYFWGPVQADANSAVCAVREGGITRYLTDSSACAAAPEPVAYPGYTVVSEIGYVVILLVALAGLIFLLRRLDVGRDRRLFFALIPFVFFGGALRVVEDANDTATDALITYPWNTLLISPIIYFTVFALTLVVVAGSVAAARRGLVEGYERPTLAVGTALLVVTLGYLAALAATGDAAFHLQVLVVVLIVATLSTAAVTWLVARYAPWVNEGTGRIGPVVIWGHAVDGAANVVGLDWMPALGAGPNLVPKHPVNRAVVEVTSGALPDSVLAVTGDAWPFLVIKLAAAALIVAIFDPEIFEESPRYAILLLIAVLAVGLGPGTRDMLRATFGV